MKCNRCNKPITDDECQFCWYCQGDLCDECWDEWGHCGHSEDEEFIRKAREVKQPEASC